jgi:methyl-accepting chemotaxis protein
VLLGVISSWLVARSIIGPLGRITLALTALASGERTVEIPETERDDEIGGMAKSAQVFKDNAIAIERMTIEQETLKSTAQSAQKVAMNQTAEKFESSVSSLVSLDGAAGDRAAHVGHRDRNRPAGDHGRDRIGTSHAERPGCGLGD